VNNAVQLASHNCPIEMRLELLMLGKICAVVAVLGSCVNGRFPIFVAVISELSGSRTVGPEFVGFILDKIKESSGLM
jgi:hypothetical protein